MRSGTDSSMRYGRYRIEEELGKGSMGIVYRAHDPEIDRTIALKVLRPDRIGSEAFVLRFLKEAKTIGRLSHPNIVSVYDIGQDQDTIYIAMEFVDGDPLHKRLEEGRIGVEEILNLSIQVAEALHYAHQKGVVHRDIKPSNIIVSAGDRVKITDFGIARLEDLSASIQTQAGEILGTPAYMSPEQVLGRPVDGRSDLFSLGIILYELATGRRPFQAENMAAIFRAVTEENPPLPESLNPEVPSPLSQIIQKCLEKHPEHRFQTGEALAKALRDLWAKRDLATGQGPSGLKKARVSLPFWIMGLLGVVGAGGFIYYFHAPRPVPPPTPEKVKVEKVQAAFLKVESNPEGAQVFIDGSFRGKTPARLELSPGKHEVRLLLAGHYDWEAQVQLKEESEIPLSVRLAPMEEKRPGKIGGTL